ncbi:hypothetical protein GCM10010329_29450 [Streptomyces spiroverticillatus]|uniref:Uncharacterized protein n=1 Tax=Streptomyces finlayi TaxID=67296 RepID=A0A918WW10_9ACTN|nr:hypothetical protein [Streptomyces finlayi]GHA05173.1 hypothetical protein GCM10010329_29450 [Streptomyces spiroverticillatus]GHC89107.1 hypothetical protein GCM10010334_21860 [Streptomyces finlayi]
MIPLILLGATVLGAGVIFGFSSFVVGFALLVGGVLGLVSFIAAGPGRQRPGEHETVIEERHYIGGDGHHRYDDDYYDHHRR